MKTQNIRGFTLIEILVTVLILAVGLLGIAGLQSFGLRHTNTSQLLTVADSLVTDMIERMQANMLETGKVKNVPPQPTAYDSVTGTETDPGCIASHTCTSAQLAQWDAFMWGNSVRAALKDNGSNTVTSTISNNGDGTFMVSVSWQEAALSREEDQADGSADGSVSKSYTIRYRP